MKYTPETKFEVMSVKLLSELFHSFYENMYCQRHDIAETILYAYQDAVTKIRGSARPGRILPYTEEDKAIDHLISNAGSYWIDNEDATLDRYILKTILKS